MNRRSAWGWTATLAGSDGGRFVRTGLMAAAKDEHSSLLAKGKVPIEQVPGSIAVLLNSMRTSNCTSVSLRVSLKDPRDMDMLQQTPGDLTASSQVR